jgi:hypothetical protein
MNPEYERRLEAEIDRELKGLPELRAPATLAPRVLAAIERRASVPWYRQSWPMWPVAVRAAVMLVLVALFGGICFGAWKLSPAEVFAFTTQKLAGRFSDFSATWHVLSAAIGGLSLAAKKLNAGLLATWLVAMAFGYAICMALGTVYVRFALGRR